MVPTFEVHVNTPTNHRGSATYPIPGIDIVDLTTAMTLGVGQRSTLGLGLVTPLTGPRPFDVETELYFNLKF